MQGPIAAFAGAVRGAGHLDEAVIEGQAMSYGVLPALLVLAVEREQVHDELVDLAEGAHLAGGVLDRHGDEGDIGVGRLSMGVTPSIGLVVLPYTVDCRHAVHAPHGADGGHCAVHAHAVYRGHGSHHAGGTHGVHAAHGRHTVAVHAVHGAHHGPHAAHGAGHPGSRHAAHCHTLGRVRHVTHAVRRVHGDAPHTVSHGRTHAGHGGIGGGRVVGRLLRCGNHLGRLSQEESQPRIRRDDGYYPSSAWSRQRVTKWLLSEHSVFGIAVTCCQPISCNLRPVESASYGPCCQYRYIPFDAAPPYKSLCQYSRFKVHRE